MKKILSKPPCIYFLVFLVVALIMTIYEVIKEAIFKGTLTPWQSHTITILVTSFLATFAAMIIRSWSESILKKEQIIELQQQKLTTIKLLLNAVHHIVNNFLNHFQLIKLEVKDQGTVRKETLELLDKSIEETSQQLKILEEIREPDKKESYNEIYPK